MRMPRAIPLLLFICCLSLLYSSAGARRWVASDVPNPKLYPSSCIHLPAAQQGVRDGEAELEWMWVCNPEHILEPSTVDTINKELYELSQLPQEGCNRGIQVTVLVIDRMASGSSDSDAMQFAKDIHDKWEVGDRECNNGVVFFMALGDRKWYISTGAGVKEILTPYAISHIKEKITPLLKDAEYDSAVLTAVMMMSAILKSGEPYVQSYFEWLLETVILLVVVGAFLAIFCRIPFLYFKNVFHRRTRREERRQQLQDMERRMQQGSNYVPITMCPICMEDLLPDNHNHNNDNNNENNDNNNDNTNDNARGESSEASSTLRHRVKVKNPNKTQEDRDMKSKLLFCGHKFHKRCINEWLARNDTCPICRRQRPTEPDAPQLPSGQQARVQAAGADNNFFLYANHRLLYNYSIWNVPRSSYITPTHRSSEGSGRGGGGYSFGGGSSFGGGGGGGGW